MSIEHTFSAAGVSNELVLRPGQSASYSAVGDADWLGRVELQKARATRAAWTVIDSIEGALDGTSEMEGTVRNESKSDVVLRLVATEMLDDSDPPVLDWAETVVCDITEAADVRHELRHPATNELLIQFTDEGAVFPGKVTVGGDIAIGGALAPSSGFGASPIKLAGDTYIYFGAEPPVDYTDGTPPATGEGVAGVGSLYIDTDAGKLYVNGGSKAEPIWNIVTSAEPA